MSPAKTLIQQIRTAATPFVTRTFRGKRLRHYAAFSALLGLLSIVLGLWISFGHGGMERDLRRDLGLEQARWEHDRITFSITIDDARAYEGARNQEAAFSSSQWQIDHEVEDAYATLYVALEQAGTSRQQDVARINALLEKRPPDLSQFGDQLSAQQFYTEQRRDYNFDWHSPRSRQRLEAILDAQLSPNLVLYQSPVDAAGAVRLTGLIAGSFVLALMLIAAPLSAGATVAQEVHENTLQPILGTRLRAKDIVMGMTASGLTLATLLAAPSFLVLIGASVLSGHALHIVPFLLLLVASSLVLTLFSQLVGLGLGRRWAGGVVAALLTAGLAFIVLVGGAVGMNLEDELIGFITISPATGLVHDLREMFLPHGRLGDTDLAFAQLVGVSAVALFATFAWALNQALTRRISGTTQASLTRVEGIVTAVAVTCAALFAVPDFGRGEPLPIYFLSLGFALLPWQLILMGRVATGDGPAALRKAPVSTVLSELAMFVGLHALVVLVLAGMTNVSWGGVFHLAWTFTVVGLIAVRVVAVPTKILSGIWVSFCMSSILAGLAQSAILFEAADSHGFGVGNSPFLFFEASPLLGVVQLGLTIWIPLSLVLALRKHTAGLS